MIALKQILKWTIICLLAFTSFNFFISADYDFERSIEINAPHFVVAKTVSDLHTWPTWAAWWANDTTIVTGYTGEEKGLGAKMNWSGSEAGIGALEIVSYSLDSMETALDFGDMQSSGIWKFESLENGNTKVTWGMTGEMPYFMRFMTMFFDAMAGPDFEKGLAGLKEVCETMPVRSSEITEVDETIN